MTFAQFLFEDLRVGISAAQWKINMRVTLQKSAPHIALPNLKVSYQYVYDRPIPLNFYKTHQVLWAEYGGGRWFDAMLAAFEADPDVEPLEFMTKWLQRHSTRSSEVLRGSSDPLGRPLRRRQAQ